MSTNHPLDNWQQWGFNKRPTLIHEYSSGLNHKVYLIRDAGAERVLKVFRDDDQGVADSISIQQYVASEKLAPKVIRWSSEYCLMERALVDLNVDKLTALKQTATALKKLHSLDVTATQRFDLMGFYEEYLEKLNDSALNQQHKRLQKILELFCNDSTQRCLCHNDLVKENIITNSSTTQFIDWDYAQLNNPLFDLAYVVVYQNLSKAEQDAFLESYNAKEPQQEAKEPQQEAKEPRQISPKLFAAAQVSVLWLDVLWCKVASVESSVVQLQKRLAAQVR